MKNHRVTAYLSAQEAIYCAYKADSGVVEFYAEDQSTTPPAVHEIIVETAFKRAKTVIDAAQRDARNAADVFFLQAASRQAAVKLPLFFAQANAEILPDSNAARGAYIAAKEAYFAAQNAAKITAYLACAASPHTLEAAEAVIRNATGCLKVARASAEASFRAAMAAIDATDEALRLDLLARILRERQADDDRMHAVRVWYAAMDAINVEYQDAIQCAVDTLKTIAEVDSEAARVVALESTKEAYYASLSELSAIYNIALDSLSAAYGEVRADERSGEQIWEMNIGIQ